MEIEKREQAQAKGQPSVIPPGSITEAFCKIGEQEWSRLKVKFDIAYFERWLLLNTPNCVN